MPPEGHDLPPPWGCQDVTLPRRRLPLSAELLRLTGCCQRVGRPESGLRPHASPRAMCENATVDRRGSTAAPRLARVPRHRSGCPHSAGSCGLPHPKVRRGPGGFPLTTMAEPAADRKARRLGHGDRGVLFGGPIRPVPCRTGRPPSEGGAQFEHGALWTPSPAPECPWRSCEGSGIARKAGRTYSPELVVLLSHGNLVGSTPPRGQYSVCRTGHRARRWPRRLGTPGRRSSHAATSSRQVCGSSGVSGEWHDPAGFDTYPGGGASVGGQIASSRRIVTRCVTHRPFRLWSTDTPGGEHVDRHGIRSSHFCERDCAR